MKIIVIGAGAMGCLYGAYLSKHNNVTMLDVYEPQVESTRTASPCWRKMARSSIFPTSVP